MANAPLVVSFQWLVMNRDRLRAIGVEVSSRAPLSLEGQ